MQLVMFSKMLQPLGPVEKAAEVMAEIGFDGVDLTVREKGHVLPEEVKQKLPEAVKAVEKHGLKVPMITSGITDMDSPHAEDVIKTAADCGVKYMKLGYWLYKEFGTIKSLIADAKKALDGIARVVGRYGITAGVHIHSGNFLTADGAIVWEIIRDFHPDRIAAYIDSGHMAVEGALSGWKMCLDLLSDRIAMCAIKDLAIQPSDDPDKRWKHGVVPLGEGFVKWPEFFKCLKESGFDGVMTIHSEYHMEVPDLIAQTKKDIAVIKRLIAEVGLC